MDKLSGLANKYLPLVASSMPTKEPNAEPVDSFKSGDQETGLLEVSRKSLVIGAGLTLAGVPLPVSAGVAAVHFVSEAAPETTSKVLKNTAVVVGGAAALVATVAAPIAGVAGSVVQHAMGHDFLPGFSS